MTVVSDTSPITTLLKIGKAGLLHEMLGNILVPRAVADELLGFHLSLPDLVEVRPAAEAGARLPGTEALGRGEAEAIRLARELSAEMLLTDDRKARVAAERLGIRCAGLVAVAVRAKEAGRIRSVLDLLRLLEDEGGFHLADTVRLEALRLAGE